MLRSLSLLGLIWSYLGCGVAVAADADRHPRPAPAATPCIQVFHDQAAAVATGSTYHAISLANLLGHWPHYEVRVRLIHNYRVGDLRKCHANFYIGTNQSTIVPEDFSRDFLQSESRVAWIGHGLEQLHPGDLQRKFAHQVVGVSLPTMNTAGQVSFYSSAIYKGSVFRRRHSDEIMQAETEYSVVEMTAKGVGADSFVVAKLMDNQVSKVVPYILRSANKFIVTDNPFTLMHANDRYMIVADILFDVLGEQPRQQKPFAFVRVEDVHGSYEVPLLSASILALRELNVPVSVSLIPLFADPLGSFAKKTVAPLSAYQNRMLGPLVKVLSEDPRNAIMWHGVTHQHGAMKNPHSGASGEDYEFWNVPDDKPIDGESPAKWVQHFRPGFDVLQKFGLKPRYWVTPHYQASAAANEVIGKTFPWIVGRAFYYASSRKAEFTLPAVSALTGVALPAVSGERLDQLANQSWDNVDMDSKAGIEQVYPYEIYRDIYGQRVIPESLSFMRARTDVLSSDQMLELAKQNVVLRDYWASFFFHPFIFTSKERGGIGRHDGDTSELKKLVNGLKQLGYQFTSLGEFEDLVGQSAPGSQPTQKRVESQTLPADVK
jgi:uncharacterized protein YdaL